MWLRHQICFVTHANAHKTDGLLDTICFRRLGEWLLLLLHQQRSFHCAMHFRYDDYTSSCLPFIYFILLFQQNGMQNYMKTPFIVHSFFDYRGIFLVCALIMMHRMITNCNWPSESCFAIFDVFMKNAANVKQLDWSVDDKNDCVVHIVMVCRRHTMWIMVDQWTVLERMLSEPYVRNEKKNELRSGLCYGKDRLLCQAFFMQ